MKNIMNFFLPAYVVEQQGKTKQEDKRTNQEKLDRDIYVIGTIATSFIITVIIIGVPILLCKYVNLF